MLVCARGIVGSKVGGDEKKAGVIWEMCCYLVLGPSLSGVYIGSCRFCRIIRSNRSKNRRHKEGIILEQRAVGDEKAREFVRCMRPIEYWLNKGRP